ncbi:MAG: Xaa-Pro peptidase family protein [Thermodesulfovibrionales bacterium]|nr:Xaa-Pro peptidase family protein [Thermodesulfovibrionales bacterium]
MTLQLSAIRKSFKGIDGLLVTDMNNIRYLTGFTGSSGFLLITREGNVFVTDFRYKEQAETGINGWDVVIEKGERAKTILKLSRRFGIKRLGFEASASYEFFRRLLKRGLVMKPFKNVIEKLRAIKDDEEISLIKMAVARAESAFLEVRPYIRKGVTENKIARMLEERLKKKGCSCIPFDIIVASGRNSSMPHARASEKRLNDGDLVVIDWGGEAGGYFSDMTRTLLIKGVDMGKKREIYQTVLEANKKAVSIISPGIESKKVDNSARYVIKKAGYGEFFGHGTGHGVGLQVHELPNISRNGKGTIKENMVFTIEPGIYVPGLGGVRIEDMVAVGKRKAEVLTSLPRELEIL